MKIYVFRWRTAG